MNAMLAPLLTGLLAPAVALLPVAAVRGGGAGPAPLAVSREMPGEMSGEQPAGLTPRAASDDRAPTGFAELAAIRRQQDRARQVRIEQRVIIRIMPGRAGRPLPPAIRDPRRGLFSEFDERAAPRLVERRMDQCVPVGAIEAVQPDGPSRLLLFMRDQRIVSAALEKGCNARDYYSGFLIDRTADGQICATRDKLQSRTGASCTMDKLRQLVEIDPDE